MGEPANNPKIINRRLDELAEEYERTPPNDPRRTEIADEVSALRRRLREFEAAKK